MSDPKTASEAFDGARKILIIQLSAIGDILRAASVVPALRRRCTGARVGMLVYQEYAEVLAGIPGLTYRHVFPNHEMKRAIQAARNDEESLKALYLHGYLPLEEIQLRKYDIAVNFHFSTASAYLTTLSCAQNLMGSYAAPDGAIDIGGREAFALYEVLKDPARRAAAKGHMVDRYHRMCGLPAEGARLGFVLPPSGGAVLPSSGNFFAVHVGAGWSAKCWPGEKWRDLMVRVHRKFGWQPVLIGADFERDRMFKGGLGDLGISVIDFCGRTFMDSAKAIARCRMFFGADSGPMHLAAALGVPVVALFGDTNAAESYPTAGRNAVIRKPKTAAIEVEEVLVAAGVVADSRGTRLPTWDDATRRVADASQLYGAFIYENPREAGIAERSVA